MVAVQHLQRSVVGPNVVTAHDQLAHPPRHRLHYVASERRPIAQRRFRQRYATARVSLRLPVQRHSILEFLAYQVGQQPSPRASSVHHLLGRRGHYPRLALRARQLLAQNFDNLEMRRHEFQHLALQVPYARLLRPAHLTHPFFGWHRHRLRLARQIRMQRAPGFAPAEPAGRLRRLWHVALTRNLSCCGLRRLRRLPAQSLQQQRQLRRAHLLTLSPVQLAKRLFQSLLQLRVVRPRMRQQLQQYRDDLFRALLLRQRNQRRAHRFEVVGALGGGFSNHGCESAVAISSVMTAIVACKKIRTPHAAFLVGRQREKRFAPVTSIPSRIRPSSAASISTHGCPPSSRCTK